MPELLLPAGNPEKLRMALHYGADAVYLAGKRFGMRASADNFTEEEIYDAANLCHLFGKKLYITVNTNPRTQEYKELAHFFDSIRDSGADALIIADVGVFSLASRMLPHIALHVSTQAGAVSAADCDFWYERGASRVVLARELSLEQIREIKELAPKGLEIEVFIHGAMCVSFSGRCMLSHYLTGRDANMGACTQPCRWEYNMYELEEVKRPGLRMPVTENELGTFIMASRDLCMIEHIPELVGSGVDSLKIEGRMKSAYYAAVTANTYRMALDAYEGATCGAGYVFRPEWKRELESVSHREYSTGYFFTSVRDDPQLVSGGGYIGEKMFAAVAEGGDGTRGFFIQRNKICEGQKVELLTRSKTGIPLIARDMRDEDGRPIESAPHPGMRFSIRTDMPVMKNDILRSAL